MACVYLFSSAKVLLFCYHPQSNYFRNNIPLTEYQWIFHAAVITWSKARYNLSKNHNIFCLLYTENTEYNLNDNIVLGGMQNLLSICSKKWRDLLLSNENHWECNPSLSWSTNLHCSLKYYSKERFLSPLLFLSIEM